MSKQIHERIQINVTYTQVIFANVTSIQNLNVQTNKQRSTWKLYSFYVYSLSKTIYLIPLRGVVFTV